MADADASFSPRGRHAAVDTEHATDDTEIIPAVTNDAPAVTADAPAAAEGKPAGPQLPAWVGRVGRNVVDRLPGLGRAFVERIPALGAAIGSGLLLCVSFPPFGWWYSAVIAFAVLTWVLLRESTTPAGGFGYGFLFGLAFNIPLLPWTGQLVGPVPWLALSAMSALFPGLFGAAAVAVRRLRGWPIWFASLWVAAEWLKCTIPFGGFPWGVVAFGQTGGPMLPIVRLGGVPLLSFAVALAGFSMTALAVEVHRWSHNRDDNPPRVLLPGLCICAVLFAIAGTWPAVRHSGTGATNDRVITVAAIQGNVPRLGLDFNAQRRAVLDYHVRETIHLADDVLAGRAPQPQLVIWPENSSDIDPLRNPDAAQEISTAAAVIHAPILVGAVLQGPNYSVDNPASTNTVIAWDPVRGPGERHDKQIVQPFGEYLPWRSFFSLLSPYANRAGYFVPVDGDGVVHAAGVPVGVTTCWEVIFDRAARESVLNGAQLLAVPTNNALFGRPMSEQQLAVAKVRAVEHDRYTVVAGTTGISAIIAPDGHEVARTNFFEPAYLDKQVHLKVDVTPATRWAPIVQAALMVVGGSALVVAILHNGWFIRRLRPGGKNKGAT
ncbi:MAG: apolipoprotein N-acyltransferase [Mycobacterium sp.]|jgi:apolipoprotein N-acyltransferase|nr:apolipoprotein N-acyltransferase [Mycobacterium sp.]